MRLITRLEEIAGAYDAILSDIWGVVHNGERAWPGACEALAGQKARGAPIVLVSNAPRPAASVIAQLDALGVPRGTYDGIVTSGDLARSGLEEKPGIGVFHLGPERDRPLFEGLDVRFCAAEDAEIVINTGLFNDDTETPDDYRELLHEIAAHRLEMICANPDIVVERGERLIYCAGALAELYERIGGAVVWAGKPHPPIYRQALRIVERVAGRRIESARVLAIGDSVRTDLAGAGRMGLDALFVAGGIHGAETGRGAALDPVVLKEMFEAAGVRPVAATSSLMP